jgi:hypothetical protein
MSDVRPFRKSDLAILSRRAALEERLPPENGGRTPPSARQDAAPEAPGIAQEREQRERAAAGFRAARGRNSERARTEEKDGVLARCAYEQRRRARTKKGGRPDPAPFGHRVRTDGVLVRCAYEQR